MQVSYCILSEISAQGIYRWSCRILQKSTLSFVSAEGTNRNIRAQYSGRSYTSCIIDSAEIFIIINSGLFERQVISEYVCKVREAGQKILGPPFVVTGILCKYSWIKWARDPCLCKMAGKERKRDWANPARFIISKNKTSSAPFRANHIKPPPQAVVIWLLSTKDK